MHKVEVVAVAKRLLLILLCSIGFSQDIPEDELQAKMNSYFDNFGVVILYPTVSYRKAVSEKMTVTGRYLVDMVSAASMQRVFQADVGINSSGNYVDGITSATPGNGGGDDTPDELRHELSFGTTYYLGDNTISANYLYSDEHDYTSSTITTSLSIPMAKKNTTLSLGFVKSSDLVNPQIRTWERDVHVTTVDLSLSQIFTPNLVGSFDFTYSDLTGYLSDPYQVVTLFDSNFPNNYKYYEVNHPNQRTKTAIGTQWAYSLSDTKSIQLGYRFYDDDWDVNSHTFNFKYHWYTEDRISVYGLGLRTYFQGKAYLFKPNYSIEEQYMTVDSKLDNQYSFEYQFKYSAYGGKHFKDNWMLGWFMNDERLTFDFSLNFYHRNTDTPNWASRRTDLYAYTLDFGIRYSLD